MPIWNTWFQSSVPCFHKLLWYPGSWKDLELLQYWLRKRGDPWGRMREETGYWGLAAYAGLSGKASWIGVACPRAHSGLGKQTLCSYQMLPQFPVPAAFWAASVRDCVLLTSKSLNRLFVLFELWVTGSVPAHWRVLGSKMIGIKWATLRLCFGGDPGTWSRMLKGECEILDIWFIHYLYYC